MLALAIGEKGEFVKDIQDMNTLCLPDLLLEH